MRQTCSTIGDHQTWHQWSRWGEHWGYILCFNRRKGFSHLVGWIRWYSVITLVGHFSAGPADLVAPHCTWYSSQAAEVRAFPNPLCLELTISGWAAKLPETEHFHSFRQSRPLSPAPRLIPGSSAQLRPTTRLFQATYSLLLLPRGRFWQEAEKAANLPAAGFVRARWILLVVSK